MDIGINGLPGGRSPDRVDALVWAIAALAIQARHGPRIRALWGAANMECVMRGLDPRIHHLRKSLSKGWIAGSSPAMTVVSRSADNLVIQIAPSGIIANDQIDLPLTRLMFDVLLALERADRGFVRFEIDELIDSISPGKATNKSLAMFDAANEIVRHPDV